VPEDPKDQPPTKADIPRLLAQLEACPPEERWAFEAKLVHAYLDGDDYLQAIEVFKACRDKLPDDHKTLVILDAAEALEQYGEPDEAIMLLMNRAKDLETKGHGRSHDMARIQMKQAQVLLRKSRFDEAMEHCQFALAIFNEDKLSAKDTVSVTATMGMILWEKGDYDMALKVLGQALAKAEETGIEDKIGTVNNTLGLVNYQLGNYLLALKYFGAARVHAKDNTFMTLMVDNNIGLVHHDMGDYTIAKVQYEKCLDLADELDNFPSMALAHLNLGLLAIDMGRPDEGRNRLEESLSLCRHMKERWVQALCRIGLARAYILKGNLRLARHNAEQALQLAEEMKAKESRGMALRELGRIDELEDKKADAKERLEESVAIFESMRNRFELVRSWLTLGQFQVREGTHLSKGKENIEKALGLAKTIGAKSLEKEAEAALKALTG
jgi:tetratricopeptide (TPR) repeat protein